MKRLHVQVSVEELPASIRFYRTLFVADQELRGMRAQREAADARMIGKNEQPCCYAKSDKYWVTDPTGIAWQTFRSLSRFPVNGEDTAVFDHGESSTPVEVPAAGRCVPTQRAQPDSCCAK